MTLPRTPVTDHPFLSGGDDPTFGARGTWCARWLAGPDGDDQCGRPPTDHDWTSTGFPDVDLIDRAARLMRARALAASTDDARRPYGRADADPVDEDRWGTLMSNYLGGANGSHCAAASPAVMLAVADWLDIGANPYACVSLAPMVAVARAYLAPLDEGDTFD